MIEAKIICDSLASSGVRLTTFVLTYPRFIHSEFMTHRVFSRNASSSRAIPVKKQIQMVIDNPAIPLAFTKNQKGMQGGDVLDAEAHDKALNAWLNARDMAVIQAQNLEKLEVHKQYANRILEPFAHITVVVTATDWDNFFALRCHPAAQPEICLLATLMWEAYSLEIPTELEDGLWHTPFMRSTGLLGLFQQMRMDDEPTLLLKQSVARCARVSYLTHEGTQSTPDQDLQLYDRLLGAAPLHASPAEHQAMAVGDPNVRSGNFRGWVQYRQTLKGQNITKFEGNQ